MCVHQQLAFICTTDLSFALSPVFPFDPCRLPYWTCTQERCRWENSLSISTGGGVHLIFICSSLRRPCFHVCRNDVLHNMENIQKYITHQNMDLVINFDVSPWELSSPGPVTHTTLIHHCQQQPLLFGSSAPLYPSPSLTPPPLIYVSPNLVPSLSRPTGQVADTGSSGTIWQILIRK